MVGNRPAKDTKGSRLMAGVWIGTVALPQNISSRRFLHAKQFEP